jgi:hypothetical protein
MTPPFDAVSAVLQDYFEGLHHSDTNILRKVFHPSALYACATDGTLLTMRMEEYMPVVRTDRILSIEFVGPVTALAKVECSIQPKFFTDLLTLIYVEGRWQIISKVFHYTVKA